MVQTLEPIRGGGGSVKVGTVGTVSYLMTRELESSSQRRQSPRSHGNGPLVPKKSDKQASSGLRASVKNRSPEAMGRTRTRGRDQYQITSTASPNRQKQKLPLDDEGNSNGSNRVNRKGLDFSGKTRSHKHSSHIPIPSSANTHMERTPLREKHTRKGPNIVDIVELNCGNPAGSLSNRLKKLGLSRMSHSFM